MSPIILALGGDCLTIWSGQHYSAELCQLTAHDVRVEFDYSLAQKDVGAIRSALFSYRPDVVVVHGDTDSTLLGALAARSLGLPVAHVEAGLRSFDLSMPEERNRVAVDHMSDLLFGVSRLSELHLRNEKARGRVTVVGNTIVDVLTKFADGLKEPETGYWLLTLHRPFNVDQADRILEQLDAMGERIVFPAHPRTRKAIRAKGLGFKNIDVRSAMGFLEFLAYEKHAHLILTDSGGVVEEAVFFQRPVGILRPNSERQEALNVGAAFLTTPDADTIWEHLEEWRPADPCPFGDGLATPRIVALLKEFVHGDGQAVLPGPVAQVRG